MIVNGDSLLVAGPMHPMLDELKRLADDLARDKLFHGGVVQISEGLYFRILAALTAWNARKPTPTNGELIERLRELVGDDGRIHLPIVDQGGKIIGTAYRTPEEMAREEVYVDGSGTAWVRPTGWAYFTVCRARDALEAPSRISTTADETRNGGQPVGGGDFQRGVDAWMDACFGDAIKADQLERADRFTEEALELAQTTPGFNAARAHALVDYVFGRPVGEPSQEVGGVMVTLAALCNTAGLRMDGAAATELARVWTKVQQIRAKQATKPVGSALPTADALEALGGGMQP